MSRLILCFISGRRWVGRLLGGVLRYAFDAALGAYVHVWSEAARDTSVFVECEGDDG